MLPVALAVSLNYACNVLWPALVVGVAFFFSPFWASFYAGTGLLAWAVYVACDGCEFREGRPDPKYSREAWLLKTMRSYLRLQLHRCADVETKLLSASASGKGQASTSFSLGAMYHFHTRVVAPTLWRLASEASVRIPRSTRARAADRKFVEGVCALAPHARHPPHTRCPQSVHPSTWAAHPTRTQAIFATFPHGVNSDFRACIDAMLPDAFPRTAPPRTLAATVLFRLPGVRRLCLATGCVDAGRPTAQRVLRAGLSLMVLPGGLDEQLETIHGRERVVLKARYGFVKLAMEHGVPIVPVYVFGSSDLYYTSRLLHGPRKALAKLSRVALPIYWGGWGLCAYPWPKGFPLPVPQHVVFGDPIVVPRRDQPTHAEVAVEHARFSQALIQLFDEHKARFGAVGRTLEIL